MPVLRKGIAKYVLISIAVFLSLLLVSVLIFSKIYLAEKLQSLIVDVSKAKGYEVKVGGIVVRFSGGLEIKNIEVSDSADISASPIKIGELILKPDVTSSIIKGRLEIDEISINDVDVSLPKVGFDKLKKLRTEMRDERLGDKNRRSVPVRVHRIDLNRAEIELSEGVRVYISNLECNLSGHEFEDQDGVDLKGTLIFLGNKIGLNGMIETFSNETKGELHIDIADFKMGLLANVLENLKSPYLHGQLNFRIADTISSDGRVKLENGDESANSRSPQSAELVYDISYDTISDKMSINTLDLEMQDLLHASFDGSIDRITTEGVFDVKGSSSSTRLGNVIALFRGFSDVVASGEIEANDLMLTGSLEREDVTFSGKAVLSGVNFYDREREIKIAQLGGSLDFKKIIGRRESSGLSIEGKLNSKEVVTKIAVLEDLKGDFEFITDSRWSSSELSFTLYDLKLNTGLSDKIDISNLKTTRPIIINFNEASNKSSSAIENKLSQNSISLTARDLVFNEASYMNFRIQSASIDDLFVTYQTNQNVSLRLTVNGSKIRDVNDSMYLDKILVNLASDKNGGLGFNGKVDLRDGRYGGFKLPLITCDYTFKNGEIELTNLEAGMEGLGDLKAKESRIIFGGEGDRFLDKIRFSQASFHESEYGIESSGIGGEFKFFDGTSKEKGWGGVIIADEVKIKSHSAREVSLKLVYSRDGIRVDDLKGSLFGGRLGGRLLINKAKPVSSISSSLRIEGANIPYGSNLFFLDRMVVDFSGTLDKGLTPQGGGGLTIAGLRLGNNDGAYNIGGGLDFQTIDETLLLEKGFIASRDGQKIEFAGRIENFSDERRVLRISSNRIPLQAAKKILNPFLPESVSGGEVSGDLKLDMVFDHIGQGDLSWTGKLSLANTSFAGVISRIPIQVDGVNGAIEFDKSPKSGNLLAPLLREHHKLDKEVFKRFLSLLNHTDNYGENDFLTIDEIKYGFLSLDDIECYFNVAGLKLNLNQCVSDLFDGRIYVAGQFDYGSKEDLYNISALFKGISLEDISNRVNSIKDYITGRINGLVWLNGNGEELETVDGLFEFWSIKSKEPRRLGRAFLEKLGAKSRFFVGSSRRYDRGEISGYINDGVLTFSEFDISNTILGYKNLSIKVDPRRNTISLAHMISVMREISRRAGEGQLQIDFEKKRN